MSMDDIQSYLKDVPTWGWLVGGLVVVGGFYFGIRNPEPVPVADIEEADEGADRRPSIQQKASESQLANRLEEMKRTYQEQQQENAEDSAQVLNRQETRFKQLDDQWEEKAQALTSTYQEKVKSLENQVTDVEKMAQKEQEKSSSSSSSSGYTYKGNTYKDQRRLNDEVTHETFDEDSFSYTTDEGETIDYEEYAKRVTSGGDIT